MPARRRCPRSPHSAPRFVAGDALCQPAVFFEWKAVQEDGRTVKQPYFIRPRDENELFGFAGLSEQWVSPDGEEIHSCCIVTTDANALMMTIDMVADSQVSTCRPLSNTMVGATEDNTLRLAYRIYTRE